MVESFEANVKFAASKVRESATLDKVIVSASISAVSILVPRVALIESAATEIPVPAPTAKTPEL